MRWELCGAAFDVSRRGPTTLSTPKPNQVLADANEGWSVRGEVVTIASTASLKPALHTYPINSEATTINRRVSFRIREDSKGSRLVNRP